METSQNPTRITFRETYGIDPERMLRTLLIDTEEKLKLYRTSGTFKAAVDNLAGMLPAMVDGLATQARKADEEMTERIEALKSTPQPNVFGFRLGVDPSMPPGEAEFRNGNGEPVGRITGIGSDNV